jgi:hypothetical protein
MHAFAAACHDGPVVQGGLAQLCPGRPWTNQLVRAAWSYRHNLTAADALYVVLAEQLGASLLTDDHRLTRAATFPLHVTVLQLPAGL